MDSTHEVKNINFKINPQRDGMGKEVGGGFRMGNTCKSMADSYQCMAKTTTIAVKYLASN